ncbi:MAG: polysaccharide biosynthesis protein [Candidatus Aminicenantes bacterium]|nr:polysaccharide biosynthesis protein [Candidatus Aminicenantes bacterium]
MEWENNRILITGGTGSFGNAALKRFLKTEVSEIRIFSRDEKKQDDMRHEYNDPRIKYFIGDVRNLASIQNAVNGVDYIFHAAALKQVPSCEFYPMEAINTNAIGADNVLTAAISAGVKKVVVLSTDKAVYPINAMGMSKALMEKIMIAKARLCDPKKIVLCGTRYGNVIASRGSVIPLFITQIKTGRPLTITDPDMTRFMMTLDEAIDLVMFAFKHAKPGDIFVRKAPAATIGTLASALKKIFGANNPIKIIGTRHGEKLYETLLTREEMAKAEDLGDYFRVPMDDRDLNYGLYFSVGKKEVAKSDDYNSHNTYRLKEDELIELLLKVDYVKNELNDWKKQKKA